jgi:tetratricopeptide (TPR) repeat protein
VALPGFIATSLLVLVPGPQVVAQEQELHLLESFRSELVHLRAGDDDALIPLQELADALCADFERCDAADVLAFYASRPPSARRQGFEDERRYLALRGRVVAAGRAGLSGSAWAREREEILAALRALVIEVQDRSDFVPAAQALVLCAQIELSRVESSPLLTPAEAAAGIDRVAQDARDANALFEAAGQVTPRLELLWVLGRLERLRGRQAQARAAFESCYEDATRVHNELFREQALQGLLTLAVDAGDVAEQERHLRSLAEFRSPEESWLVARGWGQLLLNADHPERALEFVEQHAPKPGAHPTDRIDWHLLMGGALMRLGMHSEAREHFEALEGGPSTDLAELALARLSVAAGHPEEALERLRRSGFRASLGPQDLAGWHALAGEALLQSGDTAAALDELETALELTESWERATEGEAETTARNVMGEWHGLHTVALLAWAHARLGQPLEALAAIEDSQSRTLRRLDAELARLRAASGQSSTRAVVTPGEVLTWARHAELGLVTWVVGADFSVAAWVGPEVRGEERMRTQAQRIEIGRRRLEDGVRRLREAAVADDEDGVQRIAVELRDVLLPPALLERLHAAREAGEEGARLLVLLHGPLERMPLELLEIEGEPLDRWLTPLTLPGLPAADPGPAPVLGEPWMLAGDPLESGAADLPGARAELSRLRELHPERHPLLGDDFTLPNLRDALRGPGPLHVATHLIEGCEHPDGALAPTSLLLSGGERLCTHDVAEIRPRSPLVVLSACATAEGRYADAQGLGGMARAFLESGTRNVLVTLWPVEDRAAQAFSLAFHGSLASGALPSRAAREAREALRQGGWGPAAVGAFRLLGRD